MVVSLRRPLHTSLHHLKKLPPILRLGVKSCDMEGWHPIPSRPTPIQRGNTDNGTSACMGCLKAMKRAARKPFSPKTFLEGVNGGKTVGDYQKDQSVFIQNDPADAVFYIKKGKVKLTVVSEQGKEAVVALLGPTDFCGEGCLTGQTVRMATAVAMTDATIVRIEKGAMVQALHDRIEFSEKFMAYLLARNVRVEEDLVDQLFNSSEKRLARILLLLANFGKEGRPEPVMANISQETLAEMIGTTRSRVSFFMNKFRKMGFIDYNGHLNVHSSLLSVVLHDQPQLRNRME
jgi:CRP/FNR family cyclic AMP-dependent transcriptional regulator